MPEQSSINLDMEPGRNTITLNHGSESLTSQMLDGSKPEQLKAVFNPQGDLVGFEYTGCNARSVVDYLKGHQSQQNDWFLLKSAIVLFLLLLTGFLSYQLCVRWFDSNARHQVSSLY
jgi:hypothetical protein